MTNSILNPEDDAVLPANVVESDNKKVVLEVLPKEGQTLTTRDMRMAQVVVNAEAAAKQVEGAQKLKDEVIRPLNEVLRK